MQAKNLPELHKLVGERDNFICQLQTSPNCKRDYSDSYYFNDRGVNQYITSDHLKTQGSSPELRLETTNCKAVCFDCHTLRHKGIIPEGYLEPAPQTSAGYEYRRKVLAAGTKLHYAEVTTCKKCKKYNTMSSGFCSQCEPFKGSNFKKPKKEKK